MRNILALLVLLMISAAIPSVGLLAYSASRFSAAQAHVVDSSGIREIRSRREFDSYEDAIAGRYRPGTAKGYTRFWHDCPADELPAESYSESSEPSSLSFSYGSATDHTWTVYHSDFQPIRDVKSGKVHPNDLHADGRLPVLPQYNFKNDLAAWIKADLEIQGVRWTVIGSFATLFVVLACRRYWFLLRRVGKAGREMSAKVDSAIDRANSDERRDAA